MLKTDSVFLFFAVELPRPRDIADLLPLRKGSLKPRPAAPNVSDGLRVHIVLACELDACRCHALVAEIHLISKNFDGLLFGQDGAWSDILFCLWHRITGLRSYSEH